MDKCSPCPECTTWRWAEIALHLFTSSISAPGAVAVPMIYIATKTSPQLWKTTLPNLRAHSATSLSAKRYLKCTSWSSTGRPDQPQWHPDQRRVFLIRKLLSWSRIDFGIDSKINNRLISRLILHNAKTTIEKSILRLIFEGVAINLQSWNQTDWLQSIFEVQGK